MQPHFINTLLVHDERNWYAQTFKARPGARSMTMMPTFKLMVEITSILRRKNKNLETNISPPKGSVEHDFPVPKGGIC